MIQHVIYPEKELSTTGSCKHNCDLSTIKNSINDQGCKELTECRFIHDTYDICKTVTIFNIACNFPLQSPASSLTETLDVVYMCWHL